VFHFLGGVVLGVYFFFFFDGVSVGGEFCFQGWGVGVFWGGVFFGFIFGWFFVFFCLVGGVWFFSDVGFYLGVFCVSSVFLFSV